MKIKLSVLDGKTLKNNFTIPYIFEGSGDYALELVISKVIEMYYGNRTRAQVEDILKVKLTEEEINKNFELYMEKKK